MRLRNTEHKQSPLENSRCDRLSMVLHATVTVIGLRLPQRS